jgi:cobalamin biosynthesis Co2+ chelatase CbiK
MNSKKICEPNSKLQKRQINAEADERYFSFYELKNQMDSIKGFNEKIIFITKEIFHYRQADIISQNNKLPPYDEQCQQLIEQLHTLRALQAEYEKEQQEIKSKSKNLNDNSKKIKINGPLNILTNAYKQMMNSIKIAGTPYLPYKIKDIALFICNNFVDENGNPLSITTVQTYLSPSRNDKDPNNDRAVHL